MGNTKALCIFVLSVVKNIKYQMQENQNIEYKEIWKDEYFKQVCAFANSNGGILYIGIDNEGNAIGVNGTIKLLEQIPK